MNASERVGSRVLVRPVVPADFGPLYEMIVGGPALWTWRLRGQHVSPREFPDALMGGSLLTLVLEARADHDARRPLGVVSVYNHNFRDGVAYAAVAVRDGYQNAGWPLEGLVLALRIAIDNWPFRKIYFEVPAFVEEHWASGLGTWVTEEGRLSGHTFYDGKYWDLAILSVDSSLIRTVSNVLAGGPSSEQPDRT